jgi:hypothetical protein
MVIEPAPEMLAEVDNADEAAEDLARDGHTERRCLRCGGELLLERVRGGYTVRCAAENRVVLTARGL